MVRREMGDGSLGEPEGVSDAGPPGWCSTLYLAHMTWVINVTITPGMRVATARPAVSLLSVSALANMTPPTASMAQPKPLSNTWLCQGDRRMRMPHTGHSTPSGGNTGHPRMKAAMRNQFW